MIRVVFRVEKRCVSALAFGEIEVRFGPIFQLLACLNCDFLLRAFAGVEKQFGRFKIAAQFQTELGLVDRCEFYGILLVSRQMQTHGCKLCGIIRNVW